ncbi:helix-turn-helix domain-containing protein [Hydrogenophaga taeniospiralis]|uniref:helix-turn-helix domain-containing protein n=1 Tax=Hydrogenophaga taeniospiralis TaxID=65656 RepID=UPI001CF98A2F|nr:helix-turn-helix domain-containing protein [Hydrogenophaga taeniospiralis]
MSLLEAASTLKIHPHTAEKLIRTGKIPAGKIGRSYVLLSRDVLTYAEKIIIQQTADRLNKGLLGIGLKTHDTIISKTKNNRNR